MSDDANKDAVKKQLILMQMVGFSRYFHCGILLYFPT